MSSIVFIIYKNNYLMSSKLKNKSPFQQILWKILFKLTQTSETCALLSIKKLDLQKQKTTFRQ